MDKKKKFWSILVLVMYVACAGLWIRKCVAEAVRWGMIGTDTFVCAVIWSILFGLELYRYWTNRKEKP